MKYLSAIIALVLLIGSPLLGKYLSGETLEGYLVFPPVTTYPSIDHAPFSWLAFSVLLLLILLIITPFLIKIFSSGEIDFSGIDQKNGRASHRFPAWGWAGIIIIAAGWILAWTRFTWFSQLQTHTFTIPWIGYIIMVNALTFKRTGRSLLTHEPLYYACLFIFSAFFWWYFEFLNQFVVNWYYINVETLGRFEFFMYATLPFATVLPAVMSTFNLLKTFPGLSRGLDKYISIPLSNHRSPAIFGMLIAAAALSVTGTWPDYLYPMLWLAPLVILSATMVIAGVPTVFRGISKGDWSTVYLLALSALVCGFFWEMWNFYSLTRWEYAVPFVGRFRIFEMPVLGYAGYLPFGLQCGLMALLVKHILYPGSETARQRKNYNNIPMKHP